MNSQDCDRSYKRHSEKVAVYWPGQPEPTKGRPNHKSESVEFFKTFPDNHIDNDQYKILFGQGVWTCSIANFIGTFKGPMKGLDDRTIQPQSLLTTGSVSTILSCGELQKA